MSTGVFHYFTSTTAARTVIPNIIDKLVNSQRALTAKQPKQPISHATSHTTSHTTTRRPPSTTLLLRRPRPFHLRPTSQTASYNSTSRQRGYSRIARRAFDLCISDQSPTPTSRLPIKYSQLQYSPDQPPFIVPPLPSTLLFLICGYT